MTYFLLCMLCVPPNLWPLIYKACRILFCFFALLPAQRAVAQHHVVIPEHLSAPLNVSSAFDSCTEMPENAGFRQAAVKCAFRPAQGITVHHAFSRQPIWFRLRYRYETENAPTAVLTLGNYTFAQVDFFATSGEKLTAEWHTGSAKPFAARYRELREFTFSLPPAAEPAEIYLRIQSATPLNFTPRIRSLSDTLEKENTDQIVAGLLFGAQAILILYNFFLFLSLRDRSYLFYSCYVLGWLLFETKTTGFLARYVLFSLPSLDTLLLPGLVYFTLAMFVLFAEHFLYPGDGSQTARWIRRCGTALALFAIPAMLLPQYITIPLGIPVNLLITICVGWRAWCAWRMRIPSSGYFLVAVLCSISLLPVFALTRIIPVKSGFSFFYFIFHYGVPLILLAEALLLSFALADRYRRLREQKEGQRQLFENAMNAEKKLIFSELHDVVGSDLGLLMFKTAAVKDKKILLFRESIGRISAQLRELISLNSVDASLAATLSHDLRRYAAEIAEATRLGVTADISECNLSTRQAFHVQRFFYEALHNAVRHARASDLRVILRPSRQRIRLLIHDNGRGFETAKAGAKGSGLASLRNRAERLNGRFYLRSKTKKGTTLLLVFERPEKGIRLAFSPVMEAKAS